MRRSSAIYILALAGFLGGCSDSPVDQAKPVATPSVKTSPGIVGSGMPMDLDVRFAVAADAPAFKEDYTVFVHFVDENSRMIGAFDHQPPTPTSQWTPGSTIEYRHTGFAPVSDYVGETSLVVGLYSPTTGERLPMAGDLFEPRAVKAGAFEMREHSNPHPVVFREGWHPPETPRGSGLQWRWSTKSGVLSFSNPKQDVDLVLELDQPNDVFPVPQHVEVKLGDASLDSFDLPPGQALLRRIAVTENQLGGSEKVELAIVADKTFVPSRLAALRSTDTRQLGVRVFRALIQPKT
jgi:hypothetical protein